MPPETNAQANQQINNNNQQNAQDEASAAKTFQAVQAEGIVWEKEFEALCAQIDAVAASSDEIKAKVGNIRQEFNELKQKNASLYKEYVLEFNKAGHLADAQKTLEKFHDLKWGKIEDGYKDFFKKYEKVFNENSIQNSSGENVNNTFEKLKNDRTAWLKEYDAARVEDLRKKSTELAEINLGKKNYKAKTATRSGLTTNEISNDPKSGNVIYWTNTSRSFLFRYKHTIKYDPTTKTFSSQLKSFRGFGESYERQTRKEIEALVDATILQMQRDGLDPHNTTVNIKAGGPHVGKMVAEVCAERGLKFGKVEAKYFNSAEAERGDSLENPGNFQKEIDKIRQASEIKAEKMIKELTKKINAESAEATKTTTGPAPTNR